MDRCGLEANRLCLEISENAVVRHPNSARAFVNALKTLGCLVSLDDFNSGVAAFEHLRQLRLDFVKIDGSSLRRVLNDPIQQAVLRATTDIARHLGLETVAEQTETAEVLSALTDLAWTIPAPS